MRMRRCDFVRKHGQILPRLLFVPVMQNICCELNCMNTLTQGCGMSGQRRKTLKFVV